MRRRLQCWKWIRRNISQHQSKLSHRKLYHPFLTIWEDLVQSSILTIAFIPFISPATQPITIKATISTTTIIVITSTIIKDKLQQPSLNMYHKPTIREKVARVYPFKRVIIYKIFENIFMKPNFTLPQFAILQQVEGVRIKTIIHTIIELVIIQMIVSHSKNCLKHFCQFDSIILPKVFLADFPNSIMLIFREANDHLINDQGWELSMF